MISEAPRRRRRVDIGTFSLPQLQFVIVVQPQSFNVAPANVLIWSDGLSSRTRFTLVDISSMMYKYPDGANARPVTVPELYNLH